MIDNVKSVITLPSFYYSDSLLPIYFNILLFFIEDIHGVGVDHQSLSHSLGKILLSKNQFYSYRPNNMSLLLFFLNDMPLF
jgi:hypothetical protein